MKLIKNILVLFVFVFLASCSASNGQLTSRGGVLEISNGSGEQIEVFVDGSRQVVAAPGEQTVLERLISGRRVVTIKGTDSKGTAEREFDFVVDEVNRWRVEPFRYSGNDPKQARAGSCSIDIINSTPETVNVTLNNDASRKVAPGVRVRLAGIDAGRLDISASDLSGAVISRAEINMKADVIPAFVIEPPTGTIRIVNRSGRAVIVNSPDLSIRKIEDGLSSTWTGLTAESVKLVVSDIGKRTLGAFDVKLKHPEVTELIINRPNGSLNVVSDMDKPVSVFADGVLVGVCPASGGITLTGLVKGNNHLKAVNYAGETVAESWLEIRDEGNLWMVGSTSRKDMKAGTGAVSVENSWRERVDLYVDGFLSGVVEPGQKRIVAGLKPGSHSVNVIGRPSGAYVSASVEVRESGTTAWKFTPPSALLVIGNKASEPVTVLLDGRMIGRVDATSETTFLVAEGPHRIDVTGTSTKTGISRSMSFPAGSTTSIPYTSPFSTIAIANYFSDPVNIRINERSVGVLKPNEKVTITDVNPGALRLSADSTERPVAFSMLVDLQAGDAFDWNIIP